MKVIETDRLILRTWKEEDIDKYYQINQDPKVIEFLLGPYTIERVKNFIILRNEQFELLGYTLWAVEEKSSGELMGFIGLDTMEWEAPFTPCVEIGWRLGSQYWGKGYAAEGAKAVLEYGFDVVGLDEIVSITVPQNIRSIRVMERIGMKRDLNGDFAHPLLPKDHPLSKHVLYRVRKA